MCNILSSTHSSFLKLNSVYSILLTVSVTFIMSVYVFLHCLLYCAYVCTFMEQLLNLVVLLGIMTIKAFYSILFYSSHGLVFKK